MRTYIITRLVRQGVALHNILYIIYVVEIPLKIISSQEFEPWVSISEFRLC